MFKQQNTKKALESRLQNALNNTDKNRLEHALNITNRLDGKISKSIARAKYVQNSRKANWDQINDLLKPKSNNDTKSTKEKDDMEEDIEDDLYSDDEDSKKKQAPQNMFSLLKTDVEE